MDFQELIRKRYSVRAYKPDPVEDDKLARVLEAARLAPTAANRQAFRVIVVPTKGREEELAPHLRPRLVHPGPARPGRLRPARRGLGPESRRLERGRGRRDDRHVPHRASPQPRKGLGTCWIAAFDPAAAREVLGLPPDVVPSALTPLGYAADVLPPKKRKAVAEIVRRGRW